MFVVQEDDYLQHHGILGQKWGIRKTKGLKARVTGATLDYNQRQTATVKRVIAGTPLGVSEKISQVATRLFMGKKLADQMSQVTLAGLIAQKKRIESGKLNLNDKLTELLYGTGSLDLYVSRTDNRG